MTVNWLKTKILLKVTKSEILASHNSKIWESGLFRARLPGTAPAHLFPTFCRNRSNFSWLIYFLLKKTCHVYIWKTVWTRFHPRRMELANILSEWLRNPVKGTLGTLPDPPRSLHLQRSFRELIRIYPRSTPDYIILIPKMLLPKLPNLYHPLQWLL